MNNNNTVVSSVDIAEDFGKQHKHVLSAIDNIIKTINIIATGIMLYIMKSTILFFIFSPISI